MNPRIGFLLSAGLATAAGAAEFGSMDQERAATFVQLALKGIDREYPNKPGEILRGPDDIMKRRA